MRAKSLILLTVALGCGMVAAVAVSKTLLERENGSSGEAMVEILVATTEIKNASKISIEKVKIEKWPKSRLPQGVITDVKNLDGKFASQTMFPGEPILTQKISDSNDNLNLPAGYTLFDIPYENNYIKPGDWVDISGTFTQASKSKSPEVKSVLRGVQVWGINGKPDRNAENKGGKGTLFNLLIKESQYQALLLASNMGKLDLNIRPLDEEGNIKSAGEDTGQNFLNWAKDQAIAGEASENSSSERPVSTTKATPAPATQPVPPVASKKAKNEILILTSEGVKRYEYSGKELPREVSESTEQNKSPTIPVNPWQSSAGFGGYSPTYPTTYANPSSGFGSEAANANPRGVPAPTGSEPAASKPTQPKMIN